MHPLRQRPLFSQDGFRRPRPAAYSLESAGVTSLMLHGLTSVALQECKISQPEASVTTDYTCHGAFTFFPGHHDERALELGGMHGLHGMIDVRGDNSSLTMLSCEGNAIALTKAVVSVPGDDGRDSDDTATVMSIQGAFCSGLSRIITSGAIQPKLFPRTCCHRWEHERS